MIKVSSKNPKEICFTKVFLNNNITDKIKCCMGDEGLKCTIWKKYTLYKNIKN